MSEEDIITENPSREAETAPDMGAAYTAAVQEFLDNTLRLMGMDAKAVLRNETDSTVSFEFVGGDIALLIGKYGKTIDALQYLADVTAYKRYPCKKRVLLDADNHRSKRTKELEEKALKIAEMVQSYGKEAVMEPQSPKERRIIHITLANHPGVKTYSEGTGAERHVVISPK